MPIASFPVLESIILRQHPQTWAQNIQIIVIKAIDREFALFCYKWGSFNAYDIPSFGLQLFFSFNRYLQFFVFFPQVNESGLAMFPNF